MSDYGMTVTVHAPFDEVMERTTAALARHGFGILSEIDVAATLKAKIGAQIPPQVILGACSPSLAQQGLEVEPDLGLILPCNVDVRTDDSGSTRVSIFDPAAAVTITGNSALEPVTDEAKRQLRAALEELIPVAPTV